MTDVVDEWATPGIGMYQDKKLVSVTHGKLDLGDLSKEDSKEKDEAEHRYKTLTDQEAVETAGRIWERINEVNLLQNILPTREHAHLILRKGSDHSIENVRLRKI